MRVSPASIELVQLGLAELVRERGETYVELTPDKGLALAEALHTRNARLLVLESKRLDRQLVAAGL